MVITNLGLYCKESLYSEFIFANRRTVRVSSAFGTLRNEFSSWLLFLFAKKKIKVEEEKTNIHCLKIQLIPVKST